MGTENQIQVFVQSPELRIPSRSVIVNPNLTFRHVKLSFLPPTTPSQTLDSLYFSSHGKPLSDSSSLNDSGMLPFSNLILRARVFGGGGDGGATGAESRDCYLNMYAIKKPDKVDPNETRWRFSEPGFDMRNHGSSGPMVLSVCDRAWRATGSRIKSSCMLGLGMTQSELSAMLVTSLPCDEVAVTPLLSWPETP